MCKCRQKLKGDKSPPISDQVQVNLSSRVAIPVKFPDAYDGQDVYVVNRKNMRGTNGSVVVFGRSGYVPKEVKEGLLQKWPGLFS